MPETLKFLDDDGIEKEDTLLLNRPIDKFNMLLKNTNYSVYALTGNWGSGKTTFIKLWEKTLPSDGYIHIDAFEMDYETEPFVMLLKYFYAYLKHKKKIDKESLDDFKSSAKKIFARSFKILGKAGIAIVASKLLDSDNAKNVISDLSEILFDESIVTESNESSLYEKLKEILGKIAEKLEKPLYIIVDELDRCRPSFALETLEKIKHIFQIKKFKFILVYNKYILEAMIEKTYGISNGNIYLEKFIQKSISLDNDNYFTNWFLEEVQNTTENMPEYSEKLIELETHHNVFSDLKHGFGLSLRNFQTLIANIYRASLKTQV